MKTFSLTFLSIDLEINFQHQCQKNHIEVFRKNLLLFGIISSFVSGYSFIVTFWQIGLLCISYVLQLPLIYYLAKRGPKYFDFICFSFQTTLFLSIPIAHYLGFIQYPIQDLETYLIGQAITFVGQSFNLGSRFYLKVLTLFINFVGQLYLKLILNKDMSALTFLFIISNLMIIQYVYWQERIQREAFLVKHNEKLWQSEIGDFSLISIMTCVSDKGLLQLDFNKCNKSCQEQFNITDNKSYKFFLQKVQMVSRSNFRKQNMIDMKSQAKSMNTKSLYDWIFSFTDETKAIKNPHFICQYNSCQYDIKIFTTWNDQLINIHTLMTKSSEQSENKTSKTLLYERDLFTDFRQKCGTSIKTILVQLKRDQQRKKSHKCQRSLISVAYDALRLNYNLQLYLNPKCELKISHFFLGLVIDKINQIVMIGMPQPFGIKFISFVDPILKINSCQNSIFHILFNLYTIIIRCAKQPGYIQTNTTKSSTDIGSLITFCIQTNLTSSHCLTQGQRFRKKLNDKNHLISPGGQQLGFELIVSQFLVGKIGPSRNINIQDSSMLSLSFSIFQDLNQIYF